MTLQSSVLAGLEFFQDLSDELVDEFCKIAVNLLLDSVNPKVYTSAAAKLGVTADSVKTAIDALAATLLHGIRHKFSVEEYDAFLQGLRLRPVLRECILRNFQQLVDDNSNKLLSITPFTPLPEYANLNWRLDIKIASRVSRQQAKPMVMLNLQLSDQGKPCFLLLQCQPAVLLHLAKELETALNELKTREYVKVAKLVRRL